MRTENVYFYVLLWLIKHFHRKHKLKLNICICNVFISTIQCQIVANFTFDKNTMYYLINISPITDEGQQMLMNIYKFWLFVYLLY